MRAFPVLLSLAVGACATPTARQEADTSQALDTPFGVCCQPALGGGVTSGTGTGGGTSGGATPTASGSPQPVGTVQASIGVGVDPRGLALDPQGRVWVAVNGGGAIARLGDKEVAERISVQSPVDLAFDATGSAFVASDGGLFAFDKTGKPLQGAADGAAEAVAIGGSFVYATFPRDGAIRRYPIQAAGLGPGLTLPGGTGTPHDLLVDPVGRLWVAFGGADQVARYDNPGAAQVPEPVRIFGTGGDPAGLARDASSRILVIGNNAIFRVSDGTTGTQVITNSLLQGATRLAVDRAGIIWAAATTGNRLVGVTSDGKIASPAPTGLGGPVDILVDPAGRLWLSNSQSASVTRLAGS